MSGIAERLAVILCWRSCGGFFPVPASYRPCPRHEADVDALLPVVEREIAAARGEAWLEGHAAGRDYQGDGWNSDVHDPARDNPYRAALSPDPDRGEGEKA